MAINVGLAGPNVTIRADIASMSGLLTMTPEQARELAFELGIAANDAEDFRRRIVQAERARDSGFGGLWVSGERLA